MSAPRREVIGDAELWLGDCREVLPTLPAESVHCCVTSPPYWGLRDYGHDGQIGIEASVAEYVAGLVGVFREVRRVLRPDGTLWLNLGDCYAGSWGNQGRKAERGTQRPVNGGMLTRVHDGRYPAKTSNTGKINPADGLKPKDLVGLPWRVAFALQADGWWLRAENIWHKPNPMPESVEDRSTRAHEQVFMLSKGPRYFYDAEAVAEQSITNDPRRPHTSQGAWQMDGRPAEQRKGGQKRDGDSFATRNLRSVWTIATQPYAEAHFATMPPALAERCVKAGCPVGGVCLDPFAGAGTTLLVADRLQRRSVGIELSPTYCAMAAERLRRDVPLFAGAAA